MYGIGRAGDLDGRPAPSGGSRRLLMFPVGVASVVGIVVVLVFGGLWRSSSSSVPAAAPPRHPPLTVSFVDRVPALKAILEPSAFAAAVSGARNAPPPASRPLHRPVAGGRPLRVMVVGDSVGSSFANGLAAWARARGDVEVRNVARSWCALGRGALISQGLSAALPNNGCSGWTSFWSDTLRSFDPDVVIVLFTIWEMSPRQLPGRTDWLQPGSKPLDAWQLSEYQDAADLLSARGAPVVWLTIPCENEPIAVGSPLWYVNRRTIPALAASRPSVHVVDLDHELCRNGASNDYAGVDARPDGAHFSVVGAEAVSNWLMPIVLGTAPNPVTFGERAP